MEAEEVCQGQFSTRFLALIPLIEASTRGETRLVIPGRAVLDSPAPAWHAPNRIQSTNYVSPLLHVDKRAR